MRHGGLREAPPPNTEEEPGELSPRSSPPLSPSRLTVLPHQFTNKSTLERMFDSLRDVGVVKGSMQTGQLTTGTAPFNIFARIAAGLLQQPANIDTGWEGTEKENDKLGPEFKEKFMVACNRCVLTEDEYLRKARNFPLSTILRPGLKMILSIMMGPTSGRARRP